ncbi:MAG: M48 family metallopeptidase [Dissulfurimicrobium sp.]|uniref:M48 family metallopeptidase n=1 Tax=Dissulfurimicrobium sp. TaxID=2022436 RepID=UPI00404B040F
MPYNQIIALMLALLLVTGAPLDVEPFISAWPTAVFWILKAALFALSIFWLAGNRKIKSACLLLERLQWFPLILFATDLYLFDLKAYLARLIILPISGLIDISVMGLYLIYLIITWTAYWLGLRQRQFPIRPLKDDIDMRLRLILPAIIPYVAVTLARGVLGLAPWFGFNDLINSDVGGSVFILIIFIIIIIFIPLMIKSIWRCSPIPGGHVRDLIEGFLRRSGLKYRDLLLWSLDGQRLCTAAVLGVISRFRYILLTPCLIQNLTIEEIEAVLAHEAAHVKRKHILWYIIFTASYGIMIYNIFDDVWTWFVSQPSFLAAALKLKDIQPGILSLLSSLPAGVAMVLYFRFLMGYFMRNFEREADLAVFDAQAHPWHLINALEKLALLSGGIRDQPSWHHYSIAQRVEFLQYVAQHPSTKTTFLRNIRQKKTAFLCIILFLALVPYLFK